MTCRQSIPKAVSDDRQVHNGRGNAKGGAQCCERFRPSPATTGTMMAWKSSSPAGTASESSSLDEDGRMDGHRASILVVEAEETTFGFRLPCETSIEASFRGFTSSIGLLSWLFSSRDAGHPQPASALSTSLEAQLLSQECKRKKGQGDCLHSHVV